MRGLFYSVLATGALIGACSSIGANAMQNDGQATNSDNVAIYKVPLMCHAAPGIGCGSLSKPILLDLESRPIVKEAWLDRQGKTLAIVWKPGTGAAARAMVVIAVRTAHKLSAEELTGARRDAALESFHSGGGWHRGADVDRLSEEEAGSSPIVSCFAWSRRPRRSRPRPNCCDQSWRTLFASAWWDRRTHWRRDAAGHSRLI
jgi:hypothetical protein